MTDTCTWHVRHGIISLFLKKTYKMLWHCSCIYEKDIFKCMIGCMGAGLYNIAYFLKKALNI